MSPRSPAMGLLMEAVMQMAERYIDEGRWFDAIRLLSVGVELAQDEWSVGERNSPTSIYL